MFPSLLKKDPPSLESCRAWGTTGTPPEQQTPELYALLLDLCYVIT